MKKTVVFLVCLMVLAVLMVGCVSKTAETVSVGKDEVPSVYSVLGEKTISESKKGTENGTSYTEVGYNAETMTISELNDYIRDLMLNEGYTVTKEAETTDAGQTYQLGKNSDESGKVILIDFLYNNDTGAKIYYRVENGTLEDLAVSDQSAEPVADETADEGVEEAQTDEAATNEGAAEAQTDEVATDEGAAEAQTDEAATDEGAAEAPTDETPATEEPAA